MRKRNRSSRRGFTLLEVLVATAVTLLMMISLAQVFKIIGDSMKQGRSALQLNNTLRSISFRLRHDLNSLTLRIDPPADSNDGSGYFEYFDGAMTDYTSALFDPGNGTNTKAATDVVRSSRFGDLDDILMFTATSSDSWFMGQVPQFILTGVNPTTTSDYSMVTISSRHAEIIVFARPIDVDGDGTYDDFNGDSMPDGYQLHYRTLLIRPDLNDPPGTPTVDGMLPFVSSKTSPWMIAFRQPGLPPFACDMALAHQQCDLSLRRVCDGDFVANGFDRVAANSLDDLMDPANRFAHVRMPIPQSSSTTMPVLALDAGLPILNSSGPTFGNNWTGLGVGSGFLHEAFVLGRLASSTTDDARLGEDVLCSDVLAFDAKGYDPAVPILGAKGGDTSTIALTMSNFGADGSEHVTLTPNDPGYVRTLALLTNNTTSDDPIVVGYGGYVDLNWGRKTACAMPYFGLKMSDLPDRVPNVATLPTGNYLQSELSGIRTLPAAWRSSTGPDFTTLPAIMSLYRSGKAIGTGTGGNTTVPDLFQPTFDTWTTKYESDGITQTNLTPKTGVVQINGIPTLYDKSFSAENTNRYVNSLDAGSDGLDNDGTGGIDDPAELETLPPFPVKLRGIKVSIRIEDPPTRQVRQMSVANEFVTQ